MSVVGGGWSFRATPFPKPPLSQATPNWLLQLLMDLEERARGRRSRSTLLLRESILEAWEKKGGWGGRHRERLIIDWASIWKRHGDHSGERKLRDEEWRERTEGGGRKINEEKDG